MGEFQLGFGGADMDCTAEIVTHLSIHPIQVSEDFPNIITERSINGCSDNYWQLLADTGSCEPCLWQGFVFKLGWTRAAMKRY